MTRRARSTGATRLHAIRYAGLERFFFPRGTASVLFRYPAMPGARAPVTEIIENSLWLCSIGELRLEIHRAKPHGIISLTEPDDFRSWESNHANLVEFYENYAFPDGPLPDLVELQRLTNVGLDLITSEKRLIVHCAAGHNRSALLTALIVRQLHNVTGRAAMEFLQARRSCVLWNRHYAAYLNELDRPFGLQPPRGPWE